jgi:hypothetical protein
MLRRFTAIALLSLLYACGGGGGGGGSSSGGGTTPPPVIPPPPPPPPVATASITASATSVGFGDTVQLTMTATNTQSCQLTSSAPGSQPINSIGNFGPLSRRIMGATTFTYTCIGSGAAAGTTGTHSVTIAMTTPEFSLKVAQGLVSDVVWDETRNVMYLAMSSESLLAPNSIVVYDPAAGTVLSTVYAGSEPTSLSLNGDDSKLYVAYASASLVSRFSLPAFTRDFDAPIPLYRDGIYAEQPNFGIEVAAAPGVSEKFSVSLLSPQMNFPENSRKFIAYDGQTPLAASDSIPPGAVIRHLGALFAWTAPDTVVTIRDFQQGATLERYDTSAGVVRKTGELSIGNRTPGRIEFAAGRVFTNCGHVIDAITFQPLQSFARNCVTVSAFNNALVLPDAPNNRVYFIERIEEGSELLFKIDAYALDTRALLHTVRLPMNLDTQISGFVWKAVRFGTDGLAFKTGSQLVILHGALIASGGAPIVGTLPEPPIPPHWYGRLQFSTIAQSATDIAYEPLGERLYVLLAADAVAHAGEIAVFERSNLGSPTYIARPTPISAFTMSDDARYLYLAGPNSVERLNLPSRTLDATITGNGIGDNRDLDVAPGAPLTISIDGQVFDDTTVRGYAMGGHVLWGRTADRLYALNTGGSGFELDAFDSSGGGLQRIAAYSRIFSVIHPFPFYSKYSRLGDLLVSDTGLVFDPERGVVVGTFPHGSASRFGSLPAPFGASVGTPAWGPSAIDETRHRAHFLACVGVTNDDLCNTHFLTYDTRTYAPVGNMVSDIRGRAKKLVRVGTDDFAAILYGREVIFIPDPQAVGP